MKADAPDADTLLYIAVGERIRLEREALGMKQGELAAQLDYTRTSIVNIEAGRQRLPLHMLVQIAAVLCVPPSTLLPGTPGAAQNNLYRDALVRSRKERDEVRAKLAKIRAVLNQDTEGDHEGV